LLRPGPRGKDILDPATVAVKLIQKPIKSVITSAAELTKCRSLLAHKNTGTRRKLSAAARGDLKFITRSIEFRSLIISTGLRALIKNLNRCA